MKTAPLFSLSLSRQALLSRHTPPRRRSSSISPSLSALEAHLSQSLTSRPPTITYDQLSPTPSHLLNVSLSAVLPPRFHAPYYDVANPVLPFVASGGTRWGGGEGDIVAEGAHALHPGHHLIYFAPAIPPTQLLPDGTDTRHSPPLPTPFTRRMWAGGSVAFFNPPLSSSSSAGEQLLINGARAACVEGVRDVTIKGTEGKEKVFVQVERRMGYVDPQREEAESEIIARIWDGEGKGERAAVVERRTLVFQRAVEAGAAGQSAAVMERIVRPAHPPTFALTLTPPQTLLFRFSALTFNAHAIHLDPAFARAVDGHPRGCLVHGPLSLMLMLAVVQGESVGPGGMLSKTGVEKKRMIKAITYRNLAPLYAAEEMRVCVRRQRDEGTGDREGDEEVEVWIEGPRGGYAVKGTAIVGDLV